MEKVSSEVWRERIERQRASGLGMEAWCAAEGINRKTMWAWRLRLEGRGKPAPRAVAARARWRGLIAEQAGSGKPVAAFCRERGLCAPQFFAWRRKLGAEPKVARTAASFVEITAVAEAEMVLEMAGCRLRVRRGFDAGLLREVVAALREAR